MSDVISILIADDNIEFGNILREYLKREKDFHVVELARDGFQTLEMIESLNPDIVILDYVMPNLDGIGVLEHISRKPSGKKPLFIFLSAIGQENFIQRAINMGADYYFVKPFDLEVLVSRIRQISAEKGKFSFTENKKIHRNTALIMDGEGAGNDLLIEITGIIREIGIPAHISGYQFIREAILQTLKTPTVFASVTKLLYPTVALKFRTTPQKVERAIRNAIEVSWAKNDVNSPNSLKEQIFGNLKGKPTNSEFIAAIADRIKIKNS